MAYIEGAEEVRAMLETLVREMLTSVKNDLTEWGNPLASRIPGARPTVPTHPVRDLRGVAGAAGGRAGLRYRGREGDRRARRGGVRLAALLPHRLSDRGKGTDLLRAAGRRLPRKTGYFDLGFHGLEIASGGPREHRIDRLEANMHAGGFDPRKFSGYLEAFRFGMPPHGGWGLGIDRVVWMLAGLSNIREARLFPRDRYRLDP